MLNKDEKPRRRRQLDVQLATLEKIAPKRPARGWLHEIRSALGMSARQLGNYLDISQPAVAQMEQAEVDGSITLNTLKRAAEGLDCRLVYALIPNEPLEARVQRRAEEEARAVVKSVDVGMRLEDQGTSIQDQELLVCEIADDMVRSHVRELWER